MKFEKIRVLGTGSYGVVYLVKDKKSQKKYALKRMDYTTMTESCNNELKILKMIDNNNIIKIFNYYKKKNSFDIIMEYAPYGDLDNYIKKKKNIIVKFLKLK